MPWTIYHSFGLFAIMIALLSIIITFRILLHRCKAAQAQNQAYPAHSRLQQFLGRSRHPQPVPLRDNFVHGNPAIGLEEHDHWDAAILAQNDEAAIRGLRENYRHSSRSMNASVHERDISHEDGTVLVPPPPAYSPVAKVSEPASASKPLSGPAPRSTTSSISTTTSTTTTVSPPVEHISEGSQPILSLQTSTMPSQHFTTRSGNRYDLSSFAAGTPGLQLPIPDAAEVAQRLDQLKGVFKPLIAYELESRAEATQRRGDFAATAAGSVRHANLNPVPNPRYYRVDPPQDSEEMIRAANANTLPGVNILGKLCAHQNGSLPSAPPAHQNGAPSRIRTSGTPRPMVFGHRPVLRGPMPSQAAIFADDDEYEDENDPDYAPSCGFQHARTRAPGTPRQMDSTGSSSTTTPITSPRVRTPGTPRPMVFGTRPVFCGRMPSQAVTVESDHEDDESGATLRGGALIHYDINFDDDSGDGQQGLRGVSLSCAISDPDDEHKDEILDAIHEAAEPQTHHTNAHEVSTTTSEERASVHDGAKGEILSGIPNDQLKRRGPANDFEAGWVLVQSIVRRRSTKEELGIRWVDKHIISRENIISDEKVVEYQLLNDDVVREAEEIASISCISSADKPATPQEAFFLRCQPDKVVNSKPKGKTEWKKVWKLARCKAGNSDRGTRRTRSFVKIRREKKVKEDHTEMGNGDEDEWGLDGVEIFAVDTALALKAEEGHRPFFENQEQMVMNSGPTTMTKPGQKTEHRTEQLRGGWLPITVECGIESPARMTWEEELSIPFKHNKHADTKHWQCQSYISACTKCRARPATQAIDSLPKLTLEELDFLPRNHMWRFELHRAFHAIEEALIHTAVDEFLEAFKTEQDAFLDANEAEQKTFTIEDERKIRGGYLSGLKDDQYEVDHNSDTATSTQVKAVQLAFKAVEEAMMATAQLDFRAMFYCPMYPIFGAVRENIEDGHKMHKMRKSRYLRRKTCHRPTLTHYGPDVVYKWEDVAWNRPHVIVVPFDRRNRYSRGVSKPRIWGGNYLRDGTKMGYAWRNSRSPKQNVVTRSGWTRGAKKDEPCGEELVEFARNGICGGDGGLSSEVCGPLRGGQLSNEDEKDQMEALECHGAQTAHDQESETKALESQNDAREYQKQCSGPDDATTSPSDETTKLNSNVIRHLATSSPLSFLKEAFVPLPSPMVAPLYKSSLSYNGCTGMVKSMTWLALNNHHKKCSPGLCTNTCRAIVTLPFKSPQIEPLPRLESINAIAYWFGKEAEVLCNPSSGALRGGFLQGEKEEGKEDWDEINWRSPNSLRDGEPDPLADFLMRRRCSHRRVGVHTGEIHADFGGHHYECQPGRCSQFCRASDVLSASDAKTEPYKKLDASQPFIKRISPNQAGLSDASSASEVHPYSQRIAELNRILGLTLRTAFRDEYCVEGHTHPERIDGYNGSDGSNHSVRGLNGYRHNQAPERQTPPLVLPVPWHVTFPPQVQTEERSPSTTLDPGNLRGGDLEETFKMPRSGVNGWLFDKSTNWTFRRAGATPRGDRDDTKGTDTNRHSDYQELELPDSPPRTPVVGHGAEKLATVFEKMSFVPEELSRPNPSNASASFEARPNGPGYTSNCGFNPYLCWPDWAYKLYDPPHTPYQSPAYDTTGRWRRPVSRHLLAGILETLPERTGMFRRLEDGTLIRIGLQEMTAKERDTMLQYAKDKKTLRRNSWGLFPCLEARLVVEEADELKQLKEGLRGGVLEYYARGPVTAHVDSDVKWSFGCCGCHPTTPDSPVLGAIPYETTNVYHTDAGSRQSEDEVILLPIRSPLVDEHRSKWYSRPVDAKKLKDCLRGLLQSNPKLRLCKDKKRNMVSFEVPTKRTGDLPARPLKPSEVLISKIDSQKTRALKSKRIGTWVLKCGGLRGGSLLEGEEMEVDHPSPPTSDDEDEDERYVSASLPSPLDSNSEGEWEDAWEHSEDDVLDEQEMDYELSVDLLPLEDAYADLRERLSEEHQQAVEMVDQSRRDFQEEGLRRAKLQPAGHKTYTSTGERVRGYNKSEYDEELDYYPDLENVAPIVCDVEPRKLTSRITSIYNAEKEDFSPLPSSCKDLSGPFTHKINHSSINYSPDVSVCSPSDSSASFSSKGMWVMVHPRVTQLLVAGTYRYKSKHLGKNSGLMRLHEEWSHGTPSSMRLMTSVSAFRGELRREKAWETGERKRLNCIKKLRGILADLDRSIVEAEHDEDQDVLDEKDTMEVLVVEVSSNSEDHTRAIVLGEQPDPDKKKDSDAILPFIETVWDTPSIQLIELSRAEHHIVPGESERSLGKKSKRFMADNEDLTRKADERRREKLKRMVTVIEQSQISTTDLIQGLGLRGGLGYVAVDELETLSDLSGTTMKDPFVEGEEQEEEDRGEDVIDMTREIGEETDSTEKSVRNERLVRTINIAHDLAGISPEKEERKKKARRKNRYEETSETIARRFMKDMREDTRTENLKCEMSHIAFRMLRSKRMW